MSSERFWTGVCHGALILGILCLWVLSLGWIEREGRSQGRAEQEAKDKANAPKDWTETEREECAREVANGLIASTSSSAAYDEDGNLLSGPSWNISCGKDGVAIVEAPKKLPPFGPAKIDGVMIPNMHKEKPHKAAPKHMDLSVPLYTYLPKGMREADTCMDPLNNTKGCSDVPGTLIMEGYNCQNMLGTWWCSLKNFVITGDPEGKTGCPIDVTCADPPKGYRPQVESGEFDHCNGHLDPIGPSPQKGDDVDMDPVNCTIKVRVPKAEDQ